MTPFALGLVLSAAFIHATWNLFAKKVGGGAPFVWLFSALSTCLYAPLALGAFLIQKPMIDRVGLIFLAGSAALHLVYFLVLQRGYKVGDLSLVYPLARGTGPALSTVLAIVVFAERPSALALAGAGLVIFSVFLLAGGTKLFSRGFQTQTGNAIGFGLLTGTLIAAYTLWDKQAVSGLLIPPLILDWATGLGRTTLLAPVAFRNWGAVKAHLARSAQRNAHHLGAQPAFYILTSSHGAHVFARELRCACEGNKHLDWGGDGSKVSSRGGCEAEAYGRLL